MNKTKIWFSILILIVVALLVTAPLSIRPFIEDKEIKIGGYTLFKGPASKIPVIDFANLTTYENPEHNSCYLFIPEPTIILRLDDARTYSEPTKIVVNELLKENVTVTLGIIPRHLEDDEEFAAYIKSIKDDPRVEIAQHGVTHTESDRELNESEILTGYNKIQSVLGVRPVTYSAPFNDLDRSSVDVLSKYFKGITGEWGVLKEGEIAQLGHTVSNYAISQDENRTVQEVIDRCDDSLSRTNYCVVLIHPQEFATNMSNATEISEEQMEELRTMIRGLKDLNATFKNFKDVIECRETNQSFDSGFESNRTVDPDELNISEHELVDEFNMTGN